MSRTLERRRNLIGGIAFVSFVLFLIVGGFFLTKYLTSDTEKEKIQQKGIDNLKIDESKDLIYFKNETPISDDPDIVFRDVVVNLKGNETLNELINKDSENIRSSVKKISESEVDKSREILYAESDIFSSLERNYLSYESSKYLSLIVYDGEYNCYTGSQIKSIKTYNFSLSTGKQLSNETILGFNSLSIDDVKNKIRTKLEADQADFGEENQIDFDSTINAITLQNANLFFKASGKLYITVIVKTNQDSYNDTIELN